MQFQSRQKEHKPSQAYQKRKDLKRLTCEVSARHAVEDHRETHSEGLVKLCETQLALASFHLWLQIFWKILELSARSFPTSRMLKRIDRSQMNAPHLSPKLSCRQEKWLALVKGKQVKLAIPRAASKKSSVQYIVGSWEKQWKLTWLNSCSNKSCQHVPFHCKALNSFTSCFLQWWGQATPSANVAMMRPRTPQDSALQMASLFRNI